MTCGKSIALVVNTARAIEVFRGPLIRDIINKGWDAYIFAPDYTDKIERAVYEMGAHPVPYRLDRTGTNPLKEVMAIATLYRSLRNTRPDAVFAFQLKAIVYTGLAARFVALPHRYCMIEGLGSYFTDEPSRLSLPHRLLLRGGTIVLRQAVQRMEKIFTLNDGDTAFVRSLGVPREKVIELEGIGVDLDHWRPHPPWTRPITFTFIGRLIRHKGLVDFIDAARIVAQRAPEARFVVLGRLDDNPSAISKEVMEAAVADRIIEWPGHVDVKPWLAQTSVFVLPSYYREGKPRSTQEAMAMGRAIITTDVPGCRETVIDGVNGFLVPPRDPVALANAMQRFIDEPGLIAKMGAESRRLAEEKYDVHKINRIILDAMGL